jgi:uncharacterized RDD family membrane protein YckC
MQGDPVIDLLHRRTRAGWIDVLVLLVVSLIISIASGHAHSGNWTTNDNGVVTHHSGVSVFLTGGPLLLWLAIALLYYSIPEVCSGQTLGKRIMGLKVIMVNGRPLSGRAVMLRTVGRIIDVLPFFYLVGWVVMRGPRRPPQRLGDRLAGTTVVPISHP